MKAPVHQVVFSSARGRNVVSMHLAAELKPLWQAHLKAQEAEAEGADVVRFLQSVEWPNWVAFEITTCGMACGPVWSTAWTVLDLSGSEACDGV
jgi:hypothetical protein